MPAGASSDRPPEAAAGRQRAVFALPAGPYAVGFRSSDRYDYSRTYRAEVSAEGEDEHGERARPIQTSIWYPAAKTARARMRYGEYLELWAHNEGHPTSTRIAAFIESMRRGCLRDLGADLCDSIFDAQVASVRNARPASGRHPLVIYNAGGGNAAFDNSVLCEFLASHGYVVIASPSTSNWEKLKRAGPTIESAEAAARDMEFHIAFARSLPYADPGRLAVMGYSWGGLAATMVAVRNSAVRAVVSLDGSIRYFPKIFPQSIINDPTRMRAAFIQFSHSWERDKLAGELRGQNIGDRPPELKFEFYDALRYVDAYHATLKNFHHGNFSSFGTIFDNDRMPQEPSRAEDQEGYGVVAQYVLRFLEAYVNGRSEARASLSRSPAQNGVKDGSIAIDVKLAVARPAPTIAGLARYARDHGYAGLQALVERERSGDPAYMLSEQDIEHWARLLVEDEQPDQALTLRRWSVALRPESTLALGLLCMSTDDKEQRKDCYSKLLRLDPGNGAVKAELEKETASQGER